MPDSWFDDEKLVEGQKETYKFTLKYPDIIPGLKYIKDEGIRKYCCYSLLSKLRKNSHYYHS